MESFDFDEEVQNSFNKSFLEIERINWKQWLEIDSREEYEELVLKISGLSSVSDLFNRIKSETTDSRSFSINLNDFLNNEEVVYPIIFCHTSGTTDSNISKLKWFHMSIDNVRRQWAPGMQAIFESSGLDTNSSAIIFVPSRLKFDGFQEFGDKKYISLYSSEFSQRVMLSIVKPKSYLFYEYKNSKNLEIISQILTMENISVISAPAITILGWADINRLKIGLKKSMDLINQTHNSKAEQLLLEIKRKGLESTAKKIQRKLSEKLRNATLIFSISSLSEPEWVLINKFMKWERGKERFTNLYVASEVGPFAASINNGNFEISRLNRMYVFPLTLPVIEYKGIKTIISRTKDKLGRLYVSRLNNSDLLINIDIGDIISIEDQKGLPQINGKVLRNQFQLKYPIKISNQIKIESKYKTYAGDFFSLEDFEIIEPRNLLNQLKETCQFSYDSLLLIKSYENDVIKWSLVLPSSKNENCITENQMKNILLKHQKSEDLKRAINEEKINIQIIEEQPVNFLSTRAEILAQVRKGKVPKGILKKWPLYVVELI
ncbi:MAG: hypothetical protein ACFFFT_11830 [Candidatus Thorarchaeota archaeon]